MTSTAQDIGVASGEPAKWRLLHSSRGACLGTLGWQRGALFDGNPSLPHTADEWHKQVCKTYQSRDVTVSNIFLGSLKSLSTRVKITKLVQRNKPKIRVLYDLSLEIAHHERGGSYRNCRLSFPPQSKPTVCALLSDTSTLRMLEAMFSFPDHSAFAQALRGGKLTVLEAADQRVAMLLKTVLDRVSVSAVRRQPLEKNLTWQPDYSLTHYSPKEITAWREW
ncbi:hypothetical protein TREMEDRAFT_63288 [Tremella mesenterica DSM 1558]|uniref:uncharacterized protein n=1 Tax=Tremella mesenterica (strain ATCC 24925 / CBS 8224 / DSM 1558 / NBRC 9311 / NRRL Y-6157 / RJB 2259-6 / UBC 559-6) TaxID=578456 RepID=UPI0003F4914F|nr:uncharacterized protein TREMEDRAFT_63288 [Tremella mesenterica DSM 1558]EIW68823.1 hypothetical protein TREMEDRAFT_63288 [Tremella mesenterica DSM 1558]